MTALIFQGRRILEVSTLFVEGVICQVDEHVFEGFLLIRTVNRLVLLGGEPDEAFVKQEYLHRVAAENQDVQSEVKLETIY